MNGIDSECIAVKLHSSFNNQDIKSHGISSVLIFNHHYQWTRLFSRRRRFLFPTTYHWCNHHRYQWGTTAGGICRSGSFRGSAYRASVQRDFLSGTVGFEYNSNSNHPLPTTTGRVGGIWCHGAIAQTFLRHPAYPTQPTRSCPISTSRGFGPEWFQPRSYSQYLPYWWAFHNRSWYAVPYQAFQ